MRFIFKTIKKCFTAFSGALFLSLVLSIFFLIYTENITLTVKLFLCLSVTWLIYPLRFVFLLGGSGLWCYLWCTFFLVAYKHMFIPTFSIGGTLVTLVMVLLFGPFFLVWLLMTAGYLMGGNTIFEQGLEDIKLVEEIPENEIQKNKGDAFDPYLVLGVSRGATSEEIRSQYHEQMKLYHPDKVQHLGVELQKLANDKTIELTRALEMLQ